MVVDRELKIFTKFKQFWMSQGILDPKDPKFQWILRNSPDSCLFYNTWAGKLLPEAGYAPLAQFDKTKTLPECERSYFPELTDLP